MHTIKLSSPSDLADFVAHSLGYQPSEHVAVIFRDGARLGALMSLPIPQVPAGQREEIASEIAAELQRGASGKDDRLPGSVIVVAYSGSYDLAATLGYATATALGAIGRQVDDVVIVSNGQVHTYGQTIRRDPLNNAAAAVLTDAYGTVRSCREDIISEYQPAGSASLTEIDVDTAVDTWAVVLDLDADLGACDLTVAGAVLTDITTRDALTQFLLGQPQEPHRLPFTEQTSRPWLTDSRDLRTLLERLRGVCRATPTGQAADILAVTAIMDGYSGNNARTRIAADIAHAIDPEHRLTALVLAACNLGANFRDMYSQR